jgi:Na+-transporting methylmalonyl-CoA/oxaloacetate decarboxylase gamma subunit
MMNDMGAMMEGMGGMMWGMGLFGLLVLVLLVLGIAALVKYLFRDRRP